MISLFAREEMVARLAKLQAHMVKSGIELAIFDEMEAMFWLSGYANSENRWRACLVPAAGEPFFVIRAVDAAALRERTWLSDIVTFHDRDDPVAGRWHGLPVWSPHCHRLVLWILGVRSGSYGWSSHRPRSHSCDALPI